MTVARGTVLRVGFLLARDFTLSAFSLFVDCLRLGADEGDRSRPIRCQWPVMAARADPVRSSCGVMITPTSPFLPPAELDYIVVVGGLLRSRPALDPAAAAYLRAANRAGTVLVGVCTGSFVLCREGLMFGRRCCVSWFHYQDFRDEFPDQEVIADLPLLIEPDRITCSGGSNVADLAVHLIETHVSQVQARKARDVLLLNRTRAGESIQPHPPLKLGGDNSDEQVNRALLLMEQHFTQPLQISEVARLVKLSTRQLERRFQQALGVNPVAAYRELRLRYASWLLTHTAMSVTDIALETGFSDGAHFSRQFREAFGHAPRAHRTAKPRAIPERIGTLINPGLMPPDRRQYV